MTMRQTLASPLLALALWSVVPSGQSADRGPVEADYETLRVVIVMSIDDSIRRSTDMGSSIHPIFNKGLAPGTIREHRAMVDLLRRARVKVLQVRDLLQQAVEVARARGELEPWIREAFPSQYERVVREIDTIDADAILQRSDAAAPVSWQAARIDLIQALRYEGGAPPARPQFAGRMPEGPFSAYLRAAPASRP